MMRLALEPLLPQVVAVVFDTLKSTNRASVPSSVIPHLSLPLFPGKAKSINNRRKFAGYLPTLSLDYLPTAPVDKLKILHAS